METPAAKVVYATTLWRAHRNKHGLIIHKYFLIQKEFSCGLVVKILTWHVRYLGACPSWIQFFSAHLVS